MGDGVVMQMSSAKGFSLAETVIALGVLTVGIIGAAGVLSAGMQNLSSSPSDVIVAQKATEAVEAVFAARDSHRLVWSQINNVSQGGVFVDAATSLTTPGNDGLVNTADDGPIETIVLPTRTITLTGYTRQIQIQDVPNENGRLRSITVTITYQTGPSTRTYKLDTFISSYS
jgi:Tfp pilus assembly protein PilV